MAERPHLVRVAIFSSLSAAVFILDTQFPLGANIPLLYIIPMLVAVWHAGGRGLSATVICTALTIARVIWFPSGDWTLGLVNRMLTILALWSTAVLLVRFRRAEDELRTQAEAARLGEIAMAIAHELRNALGGIAAAVDVFGARLSASERDQAVRRELRNRMSSLEHFVADLLALSRPLEANLAPGSLLAVVRRAVLSFQDEPEFQGIGFTIEPTDAMADIDQPVMESALRHLLLNAAQSMDGTGTIRIVVTHNGDGCGITIHDNGPGIPPQLRDRIFEPFFTTRSRSRGLGLAIAKRAVEHHGGSLAVASDPAGGTTATVTLPGCGTH